MGAELHAPHRLRLDPEVSARFPSYVALVIYARGVTNGPSDALSLEALRAAADAQRRGFAERKPAEHPHMAAWREAYRSFGLKPGRFPNSAEALLTRLLQGGGLPPINRLVDLYNAVSVKHVLPVGGEDLGKVASDPTLRFASGDEPFEVMRDGAPVVAHPERGEVIWADQLGVTCRAWNWRQGLRTRLGQETRDAYFVLDRLAPYPLAELRAAGDELASLILSGSPRVSLETEWLGPGVRGPD
jgi:DNA/RNA-binding domain of Phe-tRNA-synthetase-like protein